MSQLKPRANDVAPQSTCTTTPTSAQLISAEYSLGFQNPSSLVLTEDKDFTVFELSSAASVSSMLDFSSKQYSHLPTPQSANSVRRYVGGPYTLESPLTTSLTSSYTLSPHAFDSRFFYTQPEESQLSSLSKVQQILTPESSPTLLQESPSPQVITTPYSGPRLGFADTPEATTTSTQLVLPGNTLSRLSSPFTDKLSFTDQINAKSPLLSQPASIHHPVQIDDVFYSMSTPPLSPQLPSRSEVERIGHQMTEDNAVHLLEAESRRPDYFKRSKRSLKESDPLINKGREWEQREREIHGIEIAVSPNKGRRLQLFQETSEESFEESLMAGGYGRYRSTDWLLQPQQTSGAAGHSNVISLSETEPISSPKEIRKRKRLAAFREPPNAVSRISKLYPVEMESRGRMLLDLSTDGPERVRQPLSTKKRISRRKNSVTMDPSSKEKMQVTEQVLPDRPNWPDLEFPWCLRSEERAEMSRVEEADRLWWIEKFLDRDSDEEDEEEEDEKPVWGNAHSEPPMARKRRGKKRPFSSVPEISSLSSMQTQWAFPPSDPADARAALLSKKSVRSLSYRKLQRARQGDNDKRDEMVCVCSGRDNGRELVQCDGCQIWYHLQCIGIKSIADLGREEDPWYCDKCSITGSDGTLSPVFLSSEPTFAQMDDEPVADTKFDLPFFQPPLQDSPITSWSSQPPIMPTPAGNNSQQDPSTPLVPSNGVYKTPGPFENFGVEDSPFDPTSTPSRGIRFGAPFTTPKNNLWLVRTNRPFQTPSKQGGVSTSKLMPGGSLLSSSDESSSGASTNTYRSLPSLDDSPIRRTKSGEGPRTTAQRLLSPTSKSLVLMWPSSDDSRSIGQKATVRRQDVPESQSLTIRI